MSITSSFYFFFPNISIQTTDGASTDEREKYIWRMHQPTETRKYQLFPAFDKLSVTVASKSPESETSSGMASVGSSTEKSLPTNHPLRKAKEQSLVRRRKVSVPELGPMTTVQEVPMDSRKSWQYTGHSPCPILT